MDRPSPSPRPSPLSPPLHVPARVSLGAALSDVAAHGLLVSYRAHRGGGELGWHEHGAAYVCVVLDGGYAQSAQHDIECTRGSLIAHPAGHAHANRFGAHATRCVNFYFDASWTGDQAIGDLLADYRHIRIDHRSAALSRLEHELQTRDAGTPLGVAAAALDLLAQAKRHDAPHTTPPWLASVRDAVASDPTRSPSLATLAALAGVHPAHLARTFRAATGETIGVFARRLRLEAADAMLLHTHASIAEVALTTGFYDQAHFARSYRRAFGMSPRARRLQSLS